MIKITMYSSAQKVAGQGVGSAYNELMHLLQVDLKNDFEVVVNQYGPTDISHYHTIDPKFYFSTFLPGRGKKIGYVHFLPETLKGSLQIPKMVQGVVGKYVIDFYKRMDEIIVVNPSFIPKLVKYGIPQEKITYIPNFVSHDEFYPLNPEARQKVRQDLGFKADDFVVMGDGQIQKRKGIDDFYRLAQNNPHLQFVWAGGFSFGRMTDGYDHYQKLIAAAPQNLRFTQIIPREKLNLYLNAADLFLLPSYDELFPMSVLEAFNTHTPVVLRDLSLYHVIIAGNYAPAADYEEMNQVINQLVKDNAKLQYWQHKSQEAAAYYSEDHLSKIWLDYYQKQVN